VGRALRPARGAAVAASDRQLSRTVQLAVRRRLRDCCIVGAVAAAITGYVALGIVLKTVSSRVFHRFAWYCIPVGLIVLAIVAGSD
jgi:undecaprenyl pyrophosphate phosphatase UppP